MSIDRGKYLANSPIFFDLERLVQNSNIEDIVIWVAHETATDIYETAKSQKLPWITPSLSLSKEDDTIFVRWVNKKKYLNFYFAYCPETYNYFTQETGDYYNRTYLDSGRLDHQLGNSVETILGIWKWLVD